MREAANALNVSLRFFQGFLATMPPCHLQAGRRKLFDHASIDTIKLEMKRRAREKCRTPLKAPAPGRSPYWRVRGTESRISMGRSTQETSKSEAQKWLAKWKADAKRESLADRSAKPLTFAGAAGSSFNAGGEAQFLRPLVLHFGERPIADISQGDIDAAAVMLYPNGGAPTREPGRLHAHKRDPAPQRRHHGVAATQGRTVAAARQLAASRTGVRAARGRRAVASDSARS